MDSNPNNYTEEVFVQCMVCSTHFEEHKGVPTEDGYTVCSERCQDDWEGR